MSKVYVTDKTSGRKMYYGFESNAKVKTLVDAGHKKVSKVQPNGTDKWDGAVWVPDTGLVKDKANLDAMKKRAIELPPVQDQLDALYAGGQAAIDMKALVNGVKTANPIT